MKTGIQVSSLKPLLKTAEQVDAACTRMAALGCRYVQLQWIDPAVPVAAIAGALTESGMKSLSVQDFYDLVQSDLEYYVNLNAATGGTWVTVSRIPERCKSREGLEVFAGELEALSRDLEPLGQRVCLHPVTADFTAVPGMNAVEYLLEKLPWLELCLDLFHLDKNCDDMPAFIRRYTGRIPMAHFKDHRDGSLVPAGSGEVRWADVVKACLDAGVEYALAEQESWDMDPYSCLGMAMEWIGKEISQA
jgi:sugar phosphate isomerase/epimerase